MTLQTLWINRHGGLTAKKEDAQSIPLYSAVDVDNCLAAALAQARREVWEEVAKQCDPNGLGPEDRSWHALNGWAFIRDWCRAQASQEEGR